MLFRAGVFLMGTLGLSGCLHHRAPPPPAVVAHPHYTLGRAYQANGFWFYPAEDYGLNTSGIASVEDAWGDDADPELTADGELRDPGALTAAMQTIQLPAIVEVTNLENGRQILVRVNDRGPASPGRIIAVSPRAALLLAMPQNGVARVHLRIDETMSRRLVEQLGGGPKLAIATAPAATITAENLPPPGAGPAGPARVLGAAAPEATGPVVPDRLPEHIQMTYADPGQLFLVCGSFGRFNYANVVAARLGGLGADVVRSHDGRQTTYTVQAGPYATIAQADQALAEALRAGVVDARITIQ
jgi:rare lipoprotein A